MTKIEHKLSPGTVIGVEVGDLPGLREAVERLTAERDEARRRERAWHDVSVLDRAESHRLTAENERLRAVALAAEAFRSAMIESGTLAQIPQSRYFTKLRSLEIALKVHQQKITLSEPTPDQEAYLRKIEEASRMPETCNSCGKPADAFGLFHCRCTGT